MTTPAHETSGGPSILVIQHESGTPAGWFGEALRDAGCRLEIATPYDGSELPGLEGHSGLLVLGGAMDSWDDQTTPWLPATRELVRRAEGGGVPTLGICLGHQIAAQALGGRAGRNPEGRTLAIASVGWLGPAARDAMFGACGGAGRATHWNSDVVLELPAQALVLARSVDGAVQAARLGDWVWGVQSHPEVDSAILQCWMEEDWAGSDEEQRQQMLRLVDEVRAAEVDLIASWQPLAAAFAGLVAGVRGGGA